jgi:hypothetical protein
MSAKYLYRLRNKIKQVIFIPLITAESRDNFTAHFTIHTVHAANIFDFVILNIRYKLTYIYMYFSRYQLSQLVSRFIYQKQFPLLVRGVRGITMVSFSTALQR